MQCRDLNFLPHPNKIPGLQATVFFANGYGVSVVMGSLFFTDTAHPYELAVLRGDAEHYELCYETPITDEVIGHLSADDVTVYLARIEALPLSGNTHG